MGKDCQTKGGLECSSLHLMSGFEKKIQQVEQGRKLFKAMFEVNELDVSDSFLVVLTKSEECIQYGLKYLPDFVSLYHKRKIYVLLDNDRYKELFAAVGGTVKICSEKELECLAVYFSLFQENERYDTKIIFFTEKDGYGFYVEELLEKQEFSLEEYVAIFLFQLEEIKKA